ncbi:receptor-like protein EIX1 [Pyrus x bretschneideri]|uniref:receptor-like protein EIX1 n=1 Tax=Pyrus x bretschneideri TaxID=225117 RepID=UPI002030E98E|nr:receptor-like protein EIX1 [Pyrus x bretschneideri]
MADAEISDSIPDKFWDLSSSFVELNLSMNQIHGKLPNLSTKNCTFSSFDLSSNLMDGPLPPFLQDNKLSGELPSLENCTELRVVDLGANKLSGKIPTWIGPNLSMLLVLRLKSNEFYGSIPLSLCSLPALHVLDFSKNNISGALPHCLANIPALSSMATEVEDSTFVGFTGVLPNNFGQLEMLESLDLSRNQISGSIPPSFSSLHYLSVLDLSYNNLSGRIPLSTQLQSFNASQFTGNHGLCGQPLTPECPVDATTEDPAVPNGSGSDQTKQDDDGLISFGFYVSLALGFIIGFWSVCGTLVLKTSWRYAYFRFFDDIKARIM